MHGVATTGSAKAVLSGPGLVCCGACGLRNEADNPTPRVRRLHRPWPWNRSWDRLPMGGIIGHNRAIPDRCGKRGLLRI
tara:strand:- start:576 stop:812 length:237 start_codon:yes stop_codon:yes gene_type:complete